MIFQDPIASLNPRRRVAEIVAEPLVVSGVRDPAERTRRVRAVHGGGRPRPRQSCGPAGRTNSPAASASASPSRARWCSSPS